MLQVYRISKDKQLTLDEIRQFISDNAKEQSRRNKLHRMYEGKHDILDRPVTDPAKPNNKIVNSYPSYIVDSYTGYFMGVPVTYSAPPKSGLEEQLQNIKDILDYNDEQSENAELAKEMSITGVAYELLYMDSDANIRFQMLEPENECIAVYDDTIEGELLYFIRAYEITDDIFANTKTKIVEVYSRTMTLKYKADGANYILIDAKANFFGGVPIVIFPNNKEQIGDFERQISEIDAYDKMQSDSVNDFEYFADAYLVLKGLNGTTEEDVKKMKKDRVLLIDAEGGAEWLVKSANDSYVENLKNRLDNDIHKFSKCPKLTDESFGNNLSGVAIKYKLIGFENVTSTKERYFKKALQRRIELICNILNLMGGDYDYTLFDMTFTRNIPVNATEAADLVNKISGIVSEETALSQLPFITDVQEEIERLKAERPTIPLDFNDEDSADEKPELLEETNA